MKTTISIILAKVVTLACKIFGPLIKKEGTVFPGKVVLSFDKKVLHKIKYPRHVIVVTGSSGKGSTVGMIAHILSKNGKKVLWNKNGSNIQRAVVALVLNNANPFTHKLNADVLLLEMDERYIDKTFKKGTITHLAITNVTRDQPARNVHPEFIYDKIMAGTDDEMTLIINADDPLLNRAKYSHPGKVVTYGVAKTKYDEVPNYPVDFAYCPSCHDKLEYESYHYGHLGLYSCPTCSFSRGSVDYEAKDVDFDRGTFSLDGSTLKLNKKVFFAVYYTTLAYTIADLIGIEKEDILREINEDEMASKRGKSYSLENRTIEMLESKNENALSYLQSMNYIKMQPGKKTVIMGFENVSRRYKYNDLSWLWDVPFEVLRDDGIDKIFLLGRFKLDVLVRLEYAGIDREKIVLIEDLSTLLDEVVGKSEGHIYTMVCFDMTAIIRNLLEARKSEKENEKKD